jgi:hypothetical protein
VSDLKEPVISDTDGHEMLVVRDRYDKRGVGTMPPDPRRMHEDFRRHYDQQRVNRDLSNRGGSQSPHALLCRCPSCRSEAERLRDAERRVASADWDDGADWDDLRYEKDDYDISEESARISDYFNSEKNEMIQVRWEEVNKRGPALEAAGWRVAALESLERDLGATFYVRPIKKP